MGIDGLQEQHDKIRQTPGSWQIAIETARELQAMKKHYPKLDLQTCTCFLHSNQDTIFEWYDFLKHELRPDKVNFNYIRPPSADPIELDIDLTRYAKLAQMIDEDSRHAAIKNTYGGKAGFFKAAIDIYMHGLIAKTQETGAAQLTCYARGHRDSNRVPPGARARIRRARNSPSRSSATRATRARSGRRGSASNPDRGCNRRSPP